MKAHHGLQGQARPTHYVVIYDENRLDADTVQGLTHKLSYLYARATKGVSLVPPAYYADLACERGRCYQHKLLQGITDTSTTATTDEQTMAEVYKEGEKLWHGGVSGANLRDTMFYL